MKTQQTQQVTTMENTKTVKTNEKALVVKNLNAFVSQLVPKKQKEKQQYNYTKGQLLYDVSFSLPRGKICVFIGHNGAGKTTTVKSILGLRPIQSGDISILGIDAKKPDSRKNIGYIPEKGNIEKIRAIKFLYDMGAYYGISKVEVFRQAKEFLEFFRIPLNRLRVKMNKLSSGQNKVITIFQGFLGNPELIIADEPTDNLDPESRDAFYDFIGAYHKKHPTTTFFIITHNLDEVEKYTDYFVCLDHGRIKYSSNYDRSPGLRKKYRVLREQ
ncbi:MAG: ABC transporter ATP-binding protein [Mycoplasmoidaceae bacterium]|nr:ABC transporter ATP-binding protein [Mycoplasmoidaceae bacterium]